MTSTIYQIRCKDIKIKDCYVGSTEDFHIRCNNHNTRCNNENSKDYNLKVYKFIRANGDMSNWIIEKIINCNEDTRYDLEVHYYKLLNSTLNTRFPRRTKKEYYLDNRQEILEYAKQYRENNKQYNKQYREKNKQKLNIGVQCECGSVVTKSGISHHYKTKKHKRYLEQIE